MLKRVYEEHRVTYTSPKEPTNNSVTSTPRTSCLPFYFPKFSIFPRFFMSARDV